MATKKKPLYTPEQQASVQLAAYCVKYLRRKRLMTTCLSVEEISIELAKEIRRYRAIELKIN